MSVTYANLAVNDYLNAAVRVKLKIHFLSEWIK